MFFIKKLKDKDIRNPDIAEGGNIGRFLKEYPFFDAEYLNDWRMNLRGNDVNLKIKHLCPTMEYNWESGNTDHSIDESISFYLPSKTLIDKLHLHFPPKQFEYWINNVKSPIFHNPSIKSKGPSCALIKTDVLYQSGLKIDKKSRMRVLVEIIKLFKTKYY